MNSYCVFHVYTRYETVRKIFHIIEPKTEDHFPCQQINALLWKYLLVSVQNFNSID